MLQKRSAQVKSFPGLLDISAAGHIDVGETPLQTAVREVQEEIGLDIDAKSLWFSGVFRTFMQVRSGFNRGKIENEFRFVYLLKLAEQKNVSFTDGEVHSVVWRSVAEVKAHLASPNKDEYVPHPSAYFAMLFNALEDCQKLTGVHFAS